MLLWHAYGGPSARPSKAVGRAWNREHPAAPITLVAVPYDAFADKITSAVPGGNGPDLFVYSHIALATGRPPASSSRSSSGVDDALADRYALDAIAAMAYRGSLWELPLATKSLALYYRTDRMTTPPATTADHSSRRPTPPQDARRLRPRLREPRSLHPRPPGCTASAAR